MTATEPTGSDGSVPTRPAEVTARGALNRLRRFVHTTPLRRILLGHRMRRILGRISSLRFLPAVTVVRRPLRFLALDLAGRGLAVHRLRAGGGAVVVDHGHGALGLLDEIFRRASYEPPAAVQAAIPPAPRILDIGANVGAYSAYALERWPDATITAIEADAHNVAGLERLVAARGSDRIRVIAAAAANHSGTVRFRGGLGPGSAGAPDGVGVPAVDVLPLFAEVDLVKMDIERGEWPILADERLADGGPLVLVMEYHRRFVDDTDALAVATELLEAAGFQVGYVTPNYWGHGTLWAWRS